MPRLNRTVLEALEDAIDSGESFGYHAGSEEMWVGAGPEDPDRRTYVVPRVEMQEAWRGLVGVLLLRGLL